MISLYSSYLSVFLFSLFLEYLNLAQFAEFRDAVKRSILPGISNCRYLGVQAHPAAVQSVLTQPGWPTEVVFPRGGVDHFQALVSYSPVHTKVGRLSGLSSFSVTDSC